MIGGAQLACFLPCVAPHHARVRVTIAICPSCTVNQYLKRKLVHEGHKGQTGTAMMRRKQKINIAWQVG